MMFLLTIFDYSLLKKLLIDNAASSMFNVYSVIVQKFQMTWKLFVRDMVDRCNAVGVRIYADVIINHMCGGDGNTGKLIN